MNNSITFLSERNKWNTNQASSSLSTQQSSLGNYEIIHPPRDIPIVKGPSLSAFLKPTQNRYSNGNKGGKVTGSFKDSIIELVNSKEVGDIYQNILNYQYKQEVLDYETILFQKQEKQIIDSQIESNPASCPQTSFELKRKNNCDIIKPNGKLPSFDQEQLQKSPHFQEVEQQINAPYVKPSFFGEVLNEKPKQQNNGENCVFERLSIRGSPLKYAGSMRNSKILRDKEIKSSTPSRFSSDSLEPTSILDKVKGRGSQQQQYFKQTLSPHSTQESSKMIRIGSHLATQQIQDQIDEVEQNQRKKRILDEFCMSEVENGVCSSGVEVEQSGILQNVVQGSEWNNYSSILDENHFMNKKRMKEGETSTQKPHLNNYKFEPQSRQIKNAQPLDDCETFRKKSQNTSRETLQMKVVRIENEEKELQLKQKVLKYYKGLLKHRLETSESGDEKENKREKGQAEISNKSIEKQNVPRGINAEQPKIKLKENSKNQNISLLSLHYPLTSPQSPQQTASSKAQTILFQKHLSSNLASKNISNMTALEYAFGSNTSNKSSNILLPHSFKTTKKYSDNQKSDTSSPAMKNNQSVTPRNRNQEKEPAECNASMYKVNNKKMQGQSSPNNNNNNNSNRDGNKLVKTIVKNTTTTPQKSNTFQSLLHSPKIQNKKNDEDHSSANIEYQSPITHPNSSLEESVMHKTTKSPGAFGGLHVAREEFLKRCSQKKRNSDDKENKQQFPDNCSSYIISSPKVIDCTNSNENSILFSNNQDDKNLKHDSYFTDKDWKGKVKPSSNCSGSFDKRSRKEVGNSNRDTFGVIVISEEDLKRRKDLEEPDKDSCIKWQNNLMFQQWQQKQSESSKIIPRISFDQCFSKIAQDPQEGDNQNLQQYLVTSKPTTTTKCQTSVQKIKNEDSDRDIASRQIKWMQERDQRVQQQKQINIKKELDMCTFKPSVNNSSSPINNSKSTISLSPFTSRKASPTNYSSMLATTAQSSQQSLKVISYPSRPPSTSSNQKSQLIKGSGTGQCIDNDKSIIQKKQGDMIQKQQLQQMSNQQSYSSILKMQQDSSNKSNISFNQSINLNPTYKVIGLKKKGSPLSKLKSK